MKKIILFLFLIPLLSKSQDTTFVTNLQLKGGTVKLVTALMYPSTSDTTVTNTFNKWRNDYIDGTPPNDNANVTISITRATTVAYIYSLLLQLPSGYAEVEDFIGEFKTSIISKRSTNTYLDRLCTDQETRFTSGLATFKSNGAQLLSSQ